MRIRTLEHASGLVGLYDRSEKFRPSQGLVRELQRKASGLRLGRTPRVLEAVLLAALGQKVANREVRAAGNRLP